MARNRNRNRGLFINDVVNNDASFLRYYDRLKELALTQFEWKNLPDTIDERFLELTLYENGNAIFFKDDVIGYLALPMASAGKLDMYRVPIKRTAYSTGYTFKGLTNKDSVICYNNYLRKPTKPYMLNYADKLWQIDRTVEVNLNAQKTPVLILCDENERLTFENLYMQYSGDRPVIYGNKSINLDSFKVLKTDAPFVADKVYQMKTQYWNEALTFLGIANVSQPKKERMVTGEVERNMGGVVASRYSRLEMRKQFCKQVNDMFGLELDCEYREGGNEYMEMCDEERTGEDNE